MKTCRVCGFSKREKEFYDGHARCKQCYCDVVKKHRDANKEHYQEYDKQRAMHPNRVKMREEYQKTRPGKASLARANKKWLANNVVKRAAHIILGNGVRDGEILKPKKCTECGSVRKIHGHHDDYKEPLNVRWLCSNCHIKWHKENGEGKMQ